MFFHEDILSYRSASCGWVHQVDNALSIVKVNPFSREAMRFVYCARNSLFRVLDGVHEM